VQCGIGVHGSLAAKGVHLQAGVPDCWAGKGLRRETGPREWPVSGCTVETWALAARRVEPTRRGFTLSFGVRSRTEGISRCAPSNHPTARDIRGSADKIVARILSGSKFLSQKGKLVKMESPPKQGICATAVPRPWNCRAPVNIIHFGISLRAALRHDSHGGDVPLRNR